MLTYNPLHFVTKENVSPLTFEIKIQDSLQYLKKAYNVNENNIELVRDSPSVEFNRDSKHYTAKYSVYNIKKDNMLVSSLNCFLSLQNDYMEISSS